MMCSRMPECALQAVSHQDPNIYNSCPHQHPHLENEEGP